MSSDPLASTLLPESSFYSLSSAKTITLTLQEFDSLCQRALLLNRTTARFYETLMAVKLRHKRFVRTARRRAKALGHPLTTV